MCVFSVMVQRMSVVVSDTRGAVRLFAKGAPEVIAQLCDPSTRTRS